MKFKKLDNTSFIVLSAIVSGIVIKHSNVFKYILLGVILLLLFKLLLRLRRYIKYKLSYIDTMTGLEFEKYVAKRLRSHAYKTKMTEKYDLGIDIIATKDGIRYGVQAKRYSGVVGASAVRQAVTALNLYECDRAIIITNSYFSRTAIRLAESNYCILLDREHLMRL